MVNFSYMAAWDVVFLSCLERVNLHPVALSGRRRTKRENECRHTVHIYKSSGKLRKGIMINLLSILRVMGIQRVD